MNIKEKIQKLTPNERLIVATLIGCGEGLKASYEDLSLVLGKEKSTVMHQVGSIKRKLGNVIREESFNRKKRLFLDSDTRRQLKEYLINKTKEN